MILPDVNVLIGAFRPDAEKHTLSSRWLGSIIDSSTPFGISPLTLAAVVRITSNVQVYYDPSPVADTARFADHILGQPHCRVVEPGPRHWDIFTKLCIDTNTTDRRMVRRARDRTRLRVDYV